MSKSVSLRALVTERLTAAAEEIFALVERTIAEYEEELCRSKEENQRKQQLLDEALRKILVHRTDAQVQTETESSCPQQGALESSKIEETLEIFNQTINSSVKTESEEQPSADDMDLEPPGHSAIQQLKTETDENQDNPAPSLLSAFQHGGCSAIKTPTGGADGDRDGNDMGKKHECCFCGRKFREERNLQRHIMVHTRSKPFICPFCSRSFSQEETLRLHMALHGEGGGASPPPSHSLGGGGGPISSAAPAKATPFSCPLCHKCFTRTFSLQSHMLTHTGEKPFPCALCGARFNRKSNLNRHLKVHAQKYHSV